MSKSVDAPVLCKTQSRNGMSRDDCEKHKAWPNRFNGLFSAYFQPIEPPSTTIKHQ